MKGISILLLVVASICFAYSIVLPNEADFVLTPFGMKHKSCVHGVPSGSHIKNGEMGLIVQTPDEEKRYSPCTIHSAPALPDGWAVDEEYVTTKAVTSFNGSWVTPGTPKDKAAQTIFTFTGLQNAVLENEVVSIIQPVLQWGVSAAGGGQYWSIASWYVNSNDDAVYSTIEEVAVGTVIDGLMYVDDSKWTIVAETADTNTNITVDVGAAELYVFVTLEVYGITTCSDYPNGVVPYTNLAVEVQHQSVTPSWTPTVTPGCKEAVNTTNPATITIKF